MEHYKVDLLVPNDIPGFDGSCDSKIFQYNWSAVTLNNNSSFTVILNCSHSKERQESDLFHELAHIICKHEMSGFLKIGDIFFRDYYEEQEEEAEWLGGCLHIPRTALEWAFRKKMPPTEIAKHYCASEDMLRYRINVTGIKKQYRYYASRFL